MALVTFTDIHKSFGPEIVLDNLNLVLNDGEKVGLIGPNGCGKTTLMKMILGQVIPDMGEIVKKKNLRTGYLPQEPVFSGERTVIEEMHAGFESILKIQKRMLLHADSMAHLTGDDLENAMKEYDRIHNEFELAGGYAYETKMHTILAGLGFEDEHYQLKTTALSGGQLARLGLALVLIADTELLMLDEPTNHLDLQATEWLENFLSNYPGAVVIISHDRFLLDNVVTKIITVEKKCTRIWTGNYSTYVEQKEIAELQEIRELDARRELVERTHDFVVRNINRKGSKGVARGRQRRMDAMLKNNPDFLEKPEFRQTIKFGFAQPNKQSNLIIRAENAGKEFGPLVLFKDLTFDLLGGERLGITGPNGTGKSTLIKMALGKIQPTAGKIRMGKYLRIGYLDQQGLQLDPAKTVLEEAQAAAPEMSNEQLRNRLGSFLFQGDDVFKKTENLSGGQHNRLILFKLVLTEPDVLVLDEPTNHLDIPSKEMLETALLEYPGTVIVVSHDRFFLDNVADKLLVVGVDKLGNKKFGEHEFINGGYSEYAALVAQRHQEQQQKQLTEKRETKRVRTKDTPKKTTPEDLKRFVMWSLDKIETQIMELEEQLSQMHQSFGDESICKEPSKLKNLQADFDATRSEIDLLYRAYEHRLEKDK